MPSVSATADGARIHSGRNFPVTAGRLVPLRLRLQRRLRRFGPAAGGTDITLYSLGFDATWEIDVFGGVRRSVQAAKAGTEAALWEMRDGEVTLTAEIATDYIALRAAQARLAILQAELEKPAFHARPGPPGRRTGFVTQLDVDQQYALMAATRGADAGAGSRGFAHWNMPSPCCWPA